MAKNKKQRIRFNSSNLFWIIPSIIFIGWVIYFFSQPPVSQVATTEEISSGLIGESVVNQGREHSDPTVVNNFEYSSNPPVSGPHDVQPSDWGVYEEQLFVGSLIHSLEHSGIIIYYNCDNIGENCIQIISELQAVHDDLVKRDPKVILSPFNDMEHRIVVAAWDHLLTLETVETDRISKFFNTYINQGPEVLHN